MQGEQRGNFSGFRDMLKSAKVRVRHARQALDFKQTVRREQG
jgi:hypothetical protein